MAESGPRGLEILRSERFDLVLLDIQMPEMDGFQVLEQITLDRVLRNIPVIMISSLDEVEGVARCIQMGAEDYSIYRSILETISQFPQRYKGGSLPLRFVQGRKDSSN